MENIREGTIEQEKGKVEIEVEKKVRKEIKLCNEEDRAKETERRSDKKESSQGLEDRKGKVEVAKNVLLGAIMLEQIL